jgi:hypothetical protein
MKNNKPYRVLRADLAKVEIKAAEIIEVAKKYYGEAEVDKLDDALSDLIFLISVAKDRAKEREDIARLAAEREAARVTAPIEKLLKQLKQGGK